MELNGSEYIVECLKAEGVKVIFRVSGSPVPPERKLKYPCLLQTSIGKMARKEMTLDEFGPLSTKT